MKFERSSGILLHPSSLPSAFGIGDFGPEAYKFVDFLAESGQKLWQILPLGPTTNGSPYSSLSVFAGNCLLISPEKLVEEELLPEAIIDDIALTFKSRVNFESIRQLKLPLLQESFKNSRKPNTTKFSFFHKHKFDVFCLKNDWWLTDYILFMALKDIHSGAPWHNWREKYWRKDFLYKKRWSSLHNEIIIKARFHAYLQYQFEKQWLELKHYANSKGIKIIGDIPFACNYDSADVWTNQELFELDENKKPIIVSGVPPNCFSSTGQLWGHPLFKWELLKQKRYDWWVKLFKRTLHLFDAVRLDHFCGFESYWAVPAQEKTAVNGKWTKGPGADFFEVLTETFGQLPLIVEDLGRVTPEVENLRDQFGFPSMRVLQFAFDSDDRNPHLPHNISENCAVYTGTHDNDTAVGWFNKLSVQNRQKVLRCLGKETTNEIHWDLIKLALSSKAKLAIIPLQDILGLDSEARMNFPGTVGENNWTWRYKPDALTDEIKNKLRELTTLSNR